MERTVIIEALCRENIEFKRLHQKHQSFEKELIEFERRLHLTPDEEMRQKNLKKGKLKLKDQMESLIREYSKNN